MNLWQSVKCIFGFHTGNSLNPLKRYCGYALCTHCGKVYNP